MKRAAVVFALVAAAACASASAVAAPAIVPLSVALSPSAKRSANALDVTISGTITCAKAYRFALIVELVQKSSGALAIGNYPGPKPKSMTSIQFGVQSQCHGQVRSWSATADSRGQVPVKLLAGPARLCAIARVRLAKPPGSSEDATSLCTDVRLS